MDIIKLLKEVAKKQSTEKKKEKPPTFAQKMKDNPWHEKWLRRDPEKSLYYARDIRGGRFPEAEKNILKNPHLKKKYIHDVLIPHFHKAYKEYGRMTDSDLKLYHAFGDVNAKKEMDKRLSARKQLGEGLRVTKTQHTVAKDNKRHVLVHMDPEDYLDLTTFTDTHKGYIKKEAQPLHSYNKFSRTKEILNSPHLTIDGNKVVAHDGRHRAAALINSGHKRMPVHLKLRDGDRDTGIDDFPDKIHGQYGRGTIHKNQLKVLKDKVASLKESAIIFLRKRNDLIMEDRIEGIKKNKGVMAKLEKNLPEINKHAPTGNYNPHIRNGAPWKKPEDVIDHIAQHDPSRNKQYLNWLVTQVNKTPRHIEDLHRFKTSLEKFHSLKNQMPIKDINQYRDEGHLHDELEKIQPTQSKRQTDKAHVANIRKEIETIYDGPDGTISIPKTKEASCFLGKGTRWCTAATHQDDDGSDNNMFDHYHKHGDLVILHDKKSNKKYQFHNESNQYMDDQDRSLEDSEKLGDIFRNGKNGYIKALAKYDPDLHANLYRNLSHYDKEPNEDYENWLKKHINDEEIYSGDVAMKLTGKDEALRYTKRFKRRIPEIEKELAKDPEKSYEYANAIDGPFPEGEDAIAKDPTFSRLYASNVLNGRFEKGEDAIKTDPYEADNYSRYVLNKRWPEAEKTIFKKRETKSQYINRFGKESPELKNYIKNDPRLAVNYAYYNGVRFPEAEDVIKKHPAAAVEYARNVIKGRWPEAEDTIKNSSEAGAYAQHVIGGRWHEAEKDIAKNPRNAVSYANRVMQGQRWPEAEDVIAKDPEAAYDYADKHVIGRFHKGEAAISKHPMLAAKYSAYKLHRAWPQAEKAIAKNAKASLNYAHYLGKRFPAGETSVLRDKKIHHQYRYHHGREILGGGEFGHILGNDPEAAYNHALGYHQPRRAREMENTIAKNPNTAKKYHDNVLVPYYKQQQYSTSIKHSELDDEELSNLHRFGNKEAGEELKKRGIEPNPPSIGKIRRPFNPLHPPRSIHENGVLKLLKNDIEPFKATSIILLRKRNDLIMEDRIEGIKKNIGLMKKIGEKLPEINKHATFKHPDASHFIDVMAKKDPTPNKEYLNWIINQIVKTPRKREDIDRIKETLSRFHSLKNQMPIKDINQYKDDGHIYSELEKIQPTQSKRQMDKEADAKIKKDIDTIYDGPDGTVSVPKTKEASCFLGRGTRWCTAADEDNMFDHYHKPSDPLVVLHDKKDNKKYQFHEGTDQYMDEEDRPIQDSHYHTQSSKKYDIAKRIIEHGKGGYMDALKKHFPGIHAGIHGNQHDFDMYDSKNLEHIKNNGALAMLYAERVRKGEFPEGEDAIAKSPEYSLEYAKHIGRRFEKSEKAILEDPDSIARYSSSILKKRWPEGEKVLKEKGSPYDLQYYAEHHNTRIPEFEDRIKENPVAAQEYARYSIKGRWPEAEETIKKDPDMAYYYAKDILKGRWPEAEETIKENPDMAYHYAKHILKGRWPEAEETIKKDPRVAAEYAGKVMKKRWPETEKHIFKNDDNSGDIGVAKSYYLHHLDHLYKTGSDEHTHTIRDLINSHPNAKTTVIHHYPESLVHRFLSPDPEQTGPDSNPAQGFKRPFNPLHPPRSIHEDGVPTNSVGAGGVPSLTDGNFKPPLNKYHKKSRLLTGKLLKRKNPNGI